MAVFLILGNAWRLPGPSAGVRSWLLTVFSIGIGLMASVLNVYFRDMQFQIWVYAHPRIALPDYHRSVSEIRGYYIPLRVIYESTPCD